MFYGPLSYLAHKIYHPFQVRDERRFVSRVAWASAAPPSYKKSLFIVNYLNPVNDISFAVRMLLEVGADIEEKGDGMTPLHWAARFGRHHRTVRMLLAAGADIEAKSEFDTCTALRYAATYHNHLVVRELLAAGANFEATNKKGETGLYGAVLFWSFC